MHALRFHAASSAFAGADRRRLLHEIQVVDGVQPALARLFDSSEVRYVQVRDFEAGCYDLRAERAERLEAA